MGLLRNSLFNLTGTAVPLAVTLVTVPLYVAQIGMERYGALAIGWLLLGYFGQADFGTGRALTQRIAARGDGGGAEIAKAIWSALGVASAFSLVGAGLVYGVAHYYFAGPFEIAAGLRAEMLAAVWVLALANPLTAINGLAGGALMGLQNFRLNALANMVGNSAGQLLPLAVASIWGPYLPWLIMAAAGGRLMGMLIAGFGVWRGALRGLPIRASWREMRQLTSFGSWVALSGIIGPLMIYADRLVIGALISAAAVAAYTIPFQLASRLQMVPIALVQALFPQLAGADAQRSIAHSRDYTIFIGQIFAPLIIVLICLSAPLLSAWLGKTLDQRSVPVATVLLAGFWINTIANVPYAQLHARGQPRFTALLHLAELPIYAVLLAVLGAQYGLVGIAGAFAMRCLLDGIFLALQSNIGLGYVVRKLILPAILIGLAMTLSGQMDGWGPALVMACGLGAICAFISIWQMPDVMRQKLAGLPFASAIPGLIRPGMGRE